MPKFRIPVFWSVGAIVEVEAADIEEAILKVEDAGPTAAKDDCYIYDSFEIDRYQARDIYADPIEEEDSG